MDKVILDRLERILVTTGQKWRDNEGNLEYPTKDTVQKVLDSLLDSLYTNLDTQQAESGGILVQNWYGHFDVYVRIGEIEDDNTREE